LLTAACCAAWAACAAAADVTSASNALARDMLAQLTAFNTTDSERGNITTAAEAMAQRLRTAGFPAEDIRVLGPSERKKNLVARLRGTGAHQPVLLIGHLDVVEARRRTGARIPFSWWRKTASSTVVAHST
jgi:acetylornithine deacetylase/succinyl-diaminopimelate desuccinylase-like protein